MLGLGFWCITLSPVPVGALLLLWVQLFVGKHPELADDEALATKASELSYSPTSLVSVGSEGLVWNDRMGDLPAADMAERLRWMVSVLEVVEARQGTSDT